MKILAKGDSPRYYTAYAALNRRILGYFASQGHDVSIVATGEGVASSLDGIKLIPEAKDNDLLTAKYCDMIKPDYIYLSNDYFTSASLLRYLKDNHPPIVQYGIIDGPLCAYSYKDVIGQVQYPVVPSKYGYSQMLDTGITSTYIPHGVDLEVFKPGEPNLDSIIKWNFPLHKFVFGSVNKNNTRKNYVGLLEAYSKLIRSGVKNTVLVCVCNPIDGFGCNLLKWCEMFGLKWNIDKYTDGDVFFLHNHLTGLTETEIVTVYQLMDVFVTTTFAEGFSLPVLEAMACGKPVIAPGHTTLPELVGEQGGSLYGLAKYSNGIPVTAPVWDIRFEHYYP